MINYIKIIFNEKMKLLLIKAENNNFFTNIFILNALDIEKRDSVSSSPNIQSVDKIKKEYIKMLRNKKNEKEKDIFINIKFNYKIPGFFKIYKEIKDYIKKEKLFLIYRQDETNLRKCQYEIIWQSMKKLSDDEKDFNEKLYTELASKQLVNKVTDIKITDKNYIEFIKLFLNDYITFYLENLYNNNIIYNFIMNDVPHKIILLLLDLKFKEFNEEEKYKIPLQDIIAKILWLEANSKYIKDLLDLYNIISESIIYEKKEKEFLFIQILNYLSKIEIKYEPKEPQLAKVNAPYYKIIIILFKCMIDEQSIKNVASKNKNDNYYLFFNNLREMLKTNTENR